MLREPKGSNPRKPQLGRACRVAAGPCVVQVQPAPFRLSVHVVEAVGGRKKETLRILLTHIIEISYCFYYLPTEMDIIRVGSNTPTSTAFAIHLAHRRQGQSLN